MLLWATWHDLALQNTARIAKYKYCGGRDRDVVRVTVRINSILNSRPTLISKPTKLDSLKSAV